MAKRKTKKEKSFTTTKQVLWVTVLIFVITVALAIWFSYEGRDTSVFMYVLPLTGGIAGATIVFYLNKSKMENIFRFKISFLEYKIKMAKKNPKEACLIDKEMSSVEEALDSKVDMTMQEAINEDINIQSY